MDELRMTELLRECVKISRGVLGFGFPIFRDELDEVYDILEKRLRELSEAKRERKRAEGKR